ncbi:MAG: acyltransferase family protein, partial [Acidimicrobiia bacterium]
MGFAASIRRTAEATPSDRNRVVDLLRVLSILVVVFGHWLMAAVTIENGELVAGHLLILADWTHPLTWLFQVMPVFFLVGGYANGLSWRSARSRNASYGGWLRARLRRLTLPVVPLLLFWTVGGWLGLRLGLDWEVLQLASQVALVPTWFLAAYVVIATIAPLGLWIWERWRWWSIIAGLALSGLCDWLSISLGIVPIGFLNYILVWGTVHQIGFAWLDGTLDETWKRALMAAAGLAGTLLLVGLGPYP